MGKSRLEGVKGQTAGSARTGGDETDRSRLDSECKGRSRVLLMGNPEEEGWHRAGMPRPLALREALLPAGGPDGPAHCSLGPPETTVS